MNKSINIVGVAGMKPLFGMRAIAEESGLDPHQVVDLLKSGRGEVVASLAVGRDGWDEYLRRSAEATTRDEWGDFIRSATEIT